MRKKKNPYEHKECFVCGKKGHGAKKCPSRPKREGDYSSDSSKSSKKSIVEDFAKKLKNASKQFAQLQAQLEEGDSESSDEDQSHFQFDAVPNDVMLKQSKGKLLADLNLRNFILLDNQSTMSVFCNRKLVNNIRNSNEPLTLHSNGGSMEVNRVADIGKGKVTVWYSKNAITNILSLKEVIARYRVLYDSYDQEFVVIREDNGLPNMVFKMHSSGLHYSIPNRADFSFVVTVEDTMAPYSKRQILAADKARTFQASLAFPSQPDYKWIVRSNQVDECPILVEDIGVAEKIWGPNVAALKGKTPRTKSIPVQTDIIQVLVEIRSLHQNVTMSMDIFSVNKIPFLITLS